MKVNFEVVKCENVEGKTIIVNIAKSLGDTMYRKALTNEEMTLGKEIYGKGEIEVNTARAELIKKCIQNNGVYLYIQRAVIPILDKIIKEDSVLEKGKKIKK